MGKWLDRLKQIEQADLDDSIHNANLKIAMWRSDGRSVWQQGNDVMVSNWHTLDALQKESLLRLQPHLATALAIEKASE